MNYGRALHLNAKQTALDSGKRHLIWREGDANWWKATHSIIYPPFFIYLQWLWTSPCICVPARLCCSLIATHTHENERSRVAFLRLCASSDHAEPLQIQKFATQPLTRIFDTNRITLATTRHSAMIYSCGRQKRPSISLSLHPFEKFNAQLAQLNHFDIANAPSKLVCDFPSWWISVITGRNHLAKQLFQVIADATYSEK